MKMRAAYDPRDDGFAVLEDEDARFAGKGHKKRPVAARANCVRIYIPGFTDLVPRRLFARGQIATIEKPPPVNPARRHIEFSTDRMSLAYV